MKLSLICIVFTALAVVCSASVQSERLVKKHHACTCTNEYLPVCAKKGGRWLTYGNDCQADCDHARSKHSGECPAGGGAPQAKERTRAVEKKAECPCPLSFDPVCGSNGITYSNAQCAECEGIKATTPGACDSVESHDIDSGEENSDVSIRICGCPFIEEPVCATKNGERLDYSNRCTAGCESATHVTDGPCPVRPGCACTMEHRPVCASKNNVFRVYDNACQAGCDQAVDARDCGKRVVRSMKRAEKKDVGRTCICTSDFDPVCARRGGRWETFSNKCAADCSGATDSSPGACPPGPCVCPADYRPVCTAAGEEYSNACQAGCAGEDHATEANCKVHAAQLPVFPDKVKKTSEPCACGRSYKPVCGNDGVTYSNSDCAVKCGGVQRHVDGNCDTACPSCARDRSFRPQVCSSTGIRYKNSCFATQCFGENDASEENCNVVAGQLPVFPEEPAQIPVFPDKKKMQY